MLLLGLDPSFTRTGVCLTSGISFKYKSIKVKECQWRIDTVLEEAHSVTVKLNTYLREQEVDFENLIAVVEYPIFATRSGSYLGVIMSKLDSYFRAKKVTIIFLPAVAVQSYTKTNGKTALVEWYKANVDTTFKGNHDEATAGVLIQIGVEVINGTYKKSSLIRKYGKEDKF